MQCCNRNLVSTSVVNSGSNIEITVPDFVICNGVCRNLIIAQKIPALDTPVPVILVVNGTKFQMLLENGNYLYSDQINCRRCYTIQFATDSSLVVVKRGCLNCTHFQFNAINPTTATAMSKTSNSSSGNSK